jgi:L-alanine-DL-glutamate epimerase-like enolase superfamily enzyme
MKVVEVDVYPVKAMLHPVICEIVTADGVSGIGEAAIASRSGRTAAAGRMRAAAHRLSLWPSRSRTSRPSLDHAKDPLPEHTHDRS